MASNKFLAYITVVQCIIGIFLQSNQPSFCASAGAGLFSQTNTLSFQHLDAKGYQWSKGDSKKPLPPNAVEAGEDKGVPVFVGVYDQGPYQCVAKVVPAWKKLFYGYNGREYESWKYHQFNMLSVSNYEWIAPSSYNETKHALIYVGRAPDGQARWIGRAQSSATNGKWVPGNLYKQSGKWLVSVPYYNKEHVHTSFEALVLNREPLGISEEKINNMNITQFNNNIYYGSVTINNQNKICQTVEVKNTNNFSLKLSFGLRFF